MRLIANLIVCAVFTLFAPVAWATNKVALVIGNGAYAHSTPLPNPTNDAADMRAVLEKLGFQVIGGNDLDQAAMGAMIGEFEDAARTAEVTLLFYAGHGLQVNGRNFLVPVNAKLERESALQFEAIDAETILRAMSGPGKTAIALLDACRDNPLSRRFARSLGATRSTAVAQGLAMPAIAGGGLLIGFATAPGDVAADGDGRNSPFTTALLKHMATPGLEVQQLMTRVKAEVFSSTRETQEPWHNSSLRSEIYLGGETSRVPDTAVANAEAVWGMVKETTSIEVLDAFIDAHAANPVLMALARERKEKLASAPATKTVVLKPLKELIPPDPASNEPPPKQDQQIAVLDQPSEPPRGLASGIDSYLDAALAANKVQTTYALLSVSEVKLPAPVKNPGPKSRSLSLKQIAKAPVIDGLVATHPEIAFARDLITECRLDWVDRCIHLPEGLVETVKQALAAKGVDMLDHSGNYFFLNRIRGSENFLLTNAPDFGDGKVAIIAAVITAKGEILATYGFDLSKSKLGVEAGAPESGVENTGVITDGQNLYVSFDGSHRCTDVPRKFGFVVKFDMASQDVKWVSPFNVSDANLLLEGNALYTANGGSCVEDFLYRLSSETGQIEARFKLPTAIERMDIKGNKLTLELYEGAGLYQLP
jgi:uncharacterized caspase-like protein